MKKKVEIGVVGSGSWGIALSMTLSKKNDVTLFFKSKNDFENVSRAGFSKYLPLIKISKEIEFTDNIKKLSDKDYIFLVAPSQTIRRNLQVMNKAKIKVKNFVLCSKGIESKSKKLLSEVINEYFRGINIMVLSGPNFADEVAKNLPTALVISGKDKRRLIELGKVINTKYFRPYFNTDMIGTQLGGAIKNIIAIACGIVHGKNLGENAKSSVLTRGLQEMIFLGTKMGASKETFYGLSGIGDLNLSCNSLKSRNFNFGYDLSRNKPKNNALTEGKLSCSAICYLGKKYGVEMPISNAVNNILKGACIEESINKLLSRPLQFEE